MGNGRIEALMADGDSRVEGRVEDAFDWRAPDYVAIFRARAERLIWVQRNPGAVPGLLAYYKDHPADLINDWGCTVDPRNIAEGKPAFLPFLLMPKQREMIDWIVAKWRSNKPGMIEKSRDVGASWIAMALACTLCMFNDGMMIGVGSAKEDKLDRSGDPDTLFYKARTFMRYLPPFLRGNWNVDKDSLYMRLLFPATGSSITGEAGDQIGRGGRKSIFFVDEAAHLEHPSLVDGALVATTDCRIDMSSVSIEGMANWFAQKRHSGSVDVFTMHWRDDLRKTEEWAAEKRATVSPSIWFSEYELNYTAAAEGVIIPQEHVQAAIDAHVKLGIAPSGVKRGALDVADEGRDLNAFAARHGILLTHCESWSGKGSDLFETAERAISRCDDWLLDGFDYDADGLGAGIRGDATRIVARRNAARMRGIRIAAYRGSGKVFDPEEKSGGTDVKNIDRYQNAKAQSWAALAARFYNTFRAVNGGDYDADNLISLASDIPELSKLCIELSQAQWKVSPTGKLQVEKAPDGMRSPNLADAVCILFRVGHRPMKIDDSALEVFGVGSGTAVF